MSKRSQRSDIIHPTIKRKRSNESDVVAKDMVLEIGFPLCRDTWSKIIEFCDTHEWLQLSYTCKGINQFKFNRLLMCNKMRTLNKNLDEQEIEHWFRLAQGTLFNVCVNWNQRVTDRHFQYLEGIHSLDMGFCKNVTDKAFTHLTGIHTLKMSYCDQITDNSFVHLTGIHTLDMTHCNQITDNAFSHLTGIRTLYMADCTHITDAAFAHLTGIHTLDMSGCDQNSITEKVLLYLTGICTLRWYVSGRDEAFIKKVVDYCESSSTMLIGMKIGMR